LNLNLDLQNVLNLKKIDLPYFSIDLLLSVFLFVFSLLSFETVPNFGSIRAIACPIPNKVCARILDFNQ